MSTSGVVRLVILVAAGASAALATASLGLSVGLDLEGGALEPARGPVCRPSVGSPRSPATFRATAGTMAPLGRTAWS